MKLTFIEDPAAVLARHLIGLDCLMWSTDYPHADSTFPHTEKVAADICEHAGLNDEEIYKLMRGNAIKGFGLHRFGITA